MFKTLFLIGIIFFSFSCQHPGHNEFSKAGFVSQKEYAILTIAEKNIADYINASIGALKGMAINGEVDKYIATFTIKEDQPLYWQGMFFLYKDNSNQNVKAKVCTITGTGSSIKCVKKIADFVKKNGCADIHVTYADRTFYVSWEGC